MPKTPKQPFKISSALRRRTALPPELQAFAEPLGELAIAWNLMEGEVNLLLVSITDNYNTMTADLVFPNLDLRDKIKALRNCGYMEQRTANWFERLEKELIDIDGVHRPSRNRFTHDQLMIEDGRVVRVTIELKLVRPQAHERSLHYRTRITVRDTDIRKVTRAILNTTENLRELRHQFEQLAPRTQRAPPQSLPQEPG
jgi:hypothetical protein